MRKAIFLRLNPKDQWGSILSVFFAIITVLMLIKSAAVMFDSWQAISGFDKCIDSAISDSTDVGAGSGLGLMVFQLKANECKQSFYEITGAQIPEGRYNLTSRQAITAFVEPVANFFIWAVLFLIAVSLLFNRSFVIPIEEVETPTRSFKRK